MSKKALKALLVVVICCYACNNGQNEHLNNFISNKVWIDHRIKQQYYFDSSTSQEYSWMTMTYDHRDLPEYEGYYISDKDSFPKSLDRYKSPFSEAKGNPDSHPYPEGVLSPYKEGWSLSSNYSIKGDSLYSQSLIDLRFDIGPSVYKLEVGKDTIIEGMTYSTLIVTNKYGRRLWRTKSHVNNLKE